MNADANLRWQEAEALTAQGQEIRARAIYLALTGDRALAPFAHLRLGVFARRDGDPDAAQQHALAAFRSACADPELLELVAKSLLRAGLVQEALACADALLRLDAPVGALAEVGKLLSDHMLPEAALALLGRALERGLPATPAVRYLIGLNRMYLGHTAQAQEALEASLRGNAELAPAHWALAKLAAPDGRAARIDRLRAALARTPGSAPDAPLLWYALFHELDRADDAAAWESLQHGMRLRRAQVRHSEAEDEALFDAAHRALRLPPAADSTGTAAESTPIFVVGMPRTGTTLIEQALCARVDAASAGELRDLTLQLRALRRQPGPPHFDARLLEAVTPEQAQSLGARYLERSRWRARSRACYIDKWPENYLAAGLLLAALGQARVVWVQRDPMDACFSNLKEWFAASYFYSYDPKETARRCARFERLGAALRERADARVAFLRYEDFVRAPESCLDRVIDRLGLPRRTSASLAPEATIVTASANQVREGISTRHVGAWRRYAEPLSPLRDELERLGLERAGDASA